MSSAYGLAWAWPYAEGQQSKLVLATLTLPHPACPLSRLQVPGDIVLQYNGTNTQA